MHNLISTNLRNFINTFEFRLNVFNDGGDFISVDTDLNGVKMLLREVDVRRSCNRQDRGCEGLRTQLTRRLTSISIA